MSNDNVAGLFFGITAGILGPETVDAIWDNVVNDTPNCEECVNMSLRNKYATDCAGQHCFVRQECPEGSCDDFMPVKLVE